MRLPEPFLLGNIIALLPALCAASSMRIVDCCESPKVSRHQAGSGNVVVSRDYARAQEERAVAIQWRQRVQGVVHEMLSPIGGSTAELMDIVTESVSVATIVRNSGSSRDLGSLRRVRE